ncbi:MAG: peptidylprolyl isomerase [Chthoniobacteraceae bacterium]
MKSPLLSRILILIATAATGLSRAAETQVLDGVAAVVNNEVITFTQVRELTAALENSLRSSYSGDALTEKIKEVRLRAVNDLVERQLIIQEFQKMKGEIPPYAVDNSLNSIIREQFGGDRSAFLRTIAAQGLTIDRIRQMEQEKIIVQAMRSRQIKEEPIIPPGRIESYYREHRQEWTVNDEVKLRMIKIVPGDEPDKKRKMIEEIRGKIVRGADFAGLARVYSEDSTQDRGGDWGWVKHGDLNPEMERIVFTLPTGKVSEVLELNATYYLLLAEEKKGGVTKPLKEVRGEIEQRLLQIERQKQQQGWLERLRKKAYVKVY